MIDATVITEVAAVVARMGSSETAADALRRQWPALRFVACSDDDVPPRLPAAHAGEGFNLYYIGSGDHCLALTSDAETAIGLVIADVVED